MFVLGLTGSIGMGKSTTAQLFAELGVPVYDADATVHRLYESEAVAAIEQAFPGTAGAKGVDREKLSGHVVGNAEAMKRLEAIVHPMLRAHEKEFLAHAEQAGAPVAVLDIPLLFETGGENRVDAVLVVSAPEEVQRQRILSRPTMTEAKLEMILARQMRDSDKRARADFVVDTSNGLDSAREQIRHVLAKVATMPRRRS
ncbi:dephospho-CoA kinase [Afipia felis]|uniref:Dephospho-CoA kinase n=2 Tax=Afipia felis TaxID=1035 RepID=A0A380W491_AFIFE|nr:dephospho-CoA kinase [Afipia felis]EKS30204.1 dephospho-CoA kinase [Afipia felis ATCC 53690]SUU74949.1 Dephospho-CoA kinase [Afipia felis]SUU83015.1 Dephospho-CoA kinase [Afipia felis]